MITRPLDLDLVLAFLHVAELSSFTRAAEATGTTQAAVSLKLRKLEARLGRTLLERSPRLVRLTADGAEFLERARRLIAADRDAQLWDWPAPAILRLGISDHAAGDTLTGMLARIGEIDPDTVFDVRMGFSRTLLAAYDSGELDAVVVRREGDRRDGEQVRENEFGWFAAPQLRVSAGSPLPLALLAEPCGVRAVAIRLLDEAGRDWREAFIGGSVSSVAAAVAAGLAIAPLAARLAPAGSVDRTADLGLPTLPASKVMLIARASDPARARILAALAAFLKASTK
jgi:DNA-binding transcriptional LysR family regulator